MKQSVADAGRWALMHIAETYGRLPETVSECEELTAAYSVRTLPVGKGAGMLIISAREIPTILYDSSRTLVQQKCAIIHELVEWLLVDKYPSLIDWDIPRNYHQDGGDSPSDLRHQAASFAEEVYKTWLKRQ